MKRNEREAIRERLVHVMVKVCTAADLVVRGAVREVGATGEDGYRVSMKEMDDLRAAIESGNAAIDTEFSAILGTLMEERATEADKLT